MQAVLKDCGVDPRIDLKDDANAAIGIATRTGLGRVRHIEVCQLWLREGVRQGIIKVFKVPTNHKIADSMTKHVSR